MCCRGAVDQENVENLAQQNLAVDTQVALVSLVVGRLRDFHIFCDQCISPVSMESGRDRDRHFRDRNCQSSLK